MSNKPYEQRAAEIIKDIKYHNLATVTPEDQAGNVTLSLSKGVTITKRK